MLLTVCTACCPYVRHRCCRNKNATTAAAQMGMPVLHRPHALVLGSHEDDLLMTQGMEGGERRDAQIVTLTSMRCSAYVGTGRR